MKFRALFDPGSFSPYRPPSIALSAVMLLAGVILASSQISRLAEYRELRYDTVQAPGVVVSVSKSMNTEGKRPYVESVVKFSFKTPDGRARSGSLVHPAVRLEHLKPGAPVEVFYKPYNPDRSTTRDDLHLRLWWGLVPVAALAGFWFAVNGMFLVQAIRRRRPRNEEANPAPRASFRRATAQGAKPMASARS